MQQLNNLEITINNNQKRLIKFRQGINIITNRPNIGRTGNSVGKSTLSRVIDYLMLGDISDIYMDDEYKKPNKVIEDLFNNNEVVATLSFTDASGLLHQISRNLATPSKSEKFYTNGESVDSKTYGAFIQDKIFSIRTRRPSVRAAVSKFIRNNAQKMLNTTKFLDPRALKKDYIEIYLYLLGFQDTSLLTEKRDATNLLSRRTRNSTAINAMIREQKPSAEIKEYQSAITELESKLLEFEFSSEHRNPIEQLSEIQSREERLTSHLLSTERKLNNIKETIELLSRDQNGYLIKEMKLIYDYSGASVSSALRNLEDAILFHKNLISKKKHFISIDIPKLEIEIEETTKQINIAREEKLRIFSAIRSKEAIESITNKLKKLGELKIHLGKLKGFMEQQEKARKDLEDAETSLAQIVKEFTKELENVRLFESKLNKHFKSITKDLHNEEYQVKVNLDESSGSCDIEIINSAANPEGGKKKAEVIAFDLAYIHAVNELSLNRPRFVFHDSAEEIDKRQIREIFLKSKELPGQQILSILSDHIDEVTLHEFKESIILLLDEDDKFFGI